MTLRREGPSSQSLTRGLLNVRLSTVRYMSVRALWYSFQHNYKYDTYLNIHLSKIYVPPLHSAASNTIFPVKNSESLKNL